jgi:hypothetical protein
MLKKIMMYVLFALIMEIFADAGTALVSHITTIDIKTEELKDKVVIKAMVNDDDNDWGGSLTGDWSFILDGSPKQDYWMALLFTYYQKDNSRANPPTTLNSLRLKITFDATHIITAITLDYSN